MEYITLNNNIKMPIIGYGVFQVPDFDECKKSVLTALDAGYRLIDTASAYQNEEAVGAAIKESKINREELFITTKLWITDAGYESTKKAFNLSLEKLGLDYLDLYLIHQPVGDVYGSYRAMEELYKEGKIKAIGVSNFQSDRLIDLILHNEIIPAVNQIEINPYFQREEEVAYMKNKNVAPEGWAPFAEIKNGILEEPILKELATKYKKSVAQIILRWNIERQVISIPKSVTPSRIQENINVFDFSLTAEELEKIASIDKKMSQFFDHRDPASIEYLSGRL